jgi:hypothetical protein
LALSSIFGLLPGTARQERRGRSTRSVIVVPFGSASSLATGRTGNRTGRTPQVWQARHVTDDLTAALVAEAAKKSDLLWVQLDTPPARPLWNIWIDDSVLLVTGGLEQPDPGLVDGGVARVTWRSKDKGSRLLSLDASVTRVDPDSDGYAEAASALHAKRLNSPDGDAALERWRAESTIWRLTPGNEVAEGPGSMSDGTHRAEVPASPAASSTWRPFHLGRATRTRR